ncbi:MAG TPA: class I SAM-dependent methyltransferase [Candidatus Acidoferrales bacterium]|nr:class I SAM-dependent methyltransferase [Candidatus Acidoferrales bacterium]
MGSDGAVEIILLTGYYSQRLSGARLKQVYDLAPEPVRRYLDSELNYVMTRIRPTDLVLELGCGYGRILPGLASRARWVVGIDTSNSSLQFARNFIQDTQNISLTQSDATKLNFREHTFDRVVCIQNGISAFHVDPRTLIYESLRVTKTGGMILFSTYSARFWRERLRWFQLQSEAGLLGEIDYDRTGDGRIVCKDGFTATTLTQEDLQKLTSGLNANITEVDESSLFCEVVPHE